MRMAMAFLMELDFHLGFPPLLGTLTAGVLITVWLNITWVQRVFWLEVLEIALFTVFWLAQTIEGWNSGVIGLLQVEPVTPPRPPAN
jgi:hypothetical protein